MYILKKLIGFLVTPLAFCSLIQIIGLGFLYRDKKKWGLILCTGGLVLLVLCSLPLVGEALMGGLETHQDATTIPAKPDLKPDVEYVVVLSGGFHPTPEYSDATRLAPDSLRRLLDAMALARQLPNATLLISGGMLTSEEQPAAVMGDLALSLGWDPSRLLLETDGKTTAEQAHRIKGMIADASFYLVTSANHMPRAMEHFTAAGLQPLPFPCDHIVQKPSLGWRSLVPSIYGLALTNAAVHEYVGRLYSWLTS